MTDFDRGDFKAAYKARTKTAEVCMAGDLVVEHQRIEAELFEVGKEAKDDMFNERVAELRRQLVELEERIQEATRTFTFQAIPSKAWQDLIAAHPPTKKQKDADRTLDHNPETFPPAAIAASSLEPKLTAEDVDWLASDPELGLQFTEFQKLWAAVLDVNLGVTERPKSVLAALTASLNRNGASSTTAAPEASPDPSS